MAEHDGKPAIYVDQAEGLKRVMHNTALYVRLLNKFKIDFDTKVGDLVAAASAGDYEKAQVLAHTLKGTAANLSLTELFKQSLEVETQIKNKAPDPESLERIKACFDETLAAIDMVLQQYG
ncbi:MAG: Hpt domain-containing protein [Spirochaetaceae bacterium]|jgi:HPt (histidine-containing phosphotransfer) domain-containing protein|nr:Hpt domain-containing protein [Spirochaetaceae bacterium]